MAYDVFHLSYNEENADESWDFLKSKVPTAKRITGISGILEAHRACAKKALTSHFFVIDSDNHLTNFDVLNYKIPEWDKQYVHLWYAHNAVNHLEYGWGGLKLFPKKIFNNPITNIDICTSFPLKIIPTVVSINKFNTSKFDTWRSAFREVVKLKSNVINDDPINLERIKSWTTMGNHNFGEWSILGANDALLFVESNQDLHLINDWSWLQEYFNSKYK